MQFLIGLLCTVSFLFGEVGISQNISEKMIVSSSKVDKVAEEDLLKLKIYFIENPATRVLQEKHHLKIEMETLDEYKVVVIKTIDSLALRNELLILLAPLFKDIFYVEYQKDALQLKSTAIETEEYTVPEIKQPQKEKTYFMDEIGLQWLALLLLSIVGLFLSIRNRRKVAAFDKTQTMLKTKQAKIETEIKKLGAQDD